MSEVFTINYNPIQSNYNPIQSQSNPIQSQLFDYIHRSHTPLMTSVNVTLTGTAISIEELVNDTNKSRDRVRMAMRKALMLSNRVIDDSHVRFTHSQLEGPQEGNRYASLCLSLSFFLLIL
jgi:hypothetical protein